MSLTIYGTPRSRTMRVLWTAAELGLDFTHVPLATGDPALQEAWFLRISPTGRIPAIDDDGFQLSESLAINLYLTKKHGSSRAPSLYPATLEGEADAWRWSLWAQGHLEPWVQQDARLAALRTAIDELAAAEIASALGVLDRHLTARAWLVGETFTVADINVASVLSPSRSSRLDLTPHPALMDWLGRCHARPAAVATRQRFA